jgi:polyhydroxyalkanoate synthase
MSPSPRVFFLWTDEVRRAQGCLLDIVGFGPQTTPSRTVSRWRTAHLLAYQAADAVQPAMLIVPAPIKAAYIWDLAPGSSGVARCMATGMQVYLVAWQRPQPGDEWMGLAEYADQVIDDCLDVIAAETGRSRVFIAGHSLGGTLAAIYSSLHSNRVHGLIELEGPIEFAAGRLEAVAAGVPRAAAIAQEFGNVPGSLLDAVSLWSDPITFNVEPSIDWAHSASSSVTWLHWRVRRWTLDETPVPRRLFEEVVEDLYRENRFATRRLRVKARLADPLALRAPVLAVRNRRSRIVPAEAIEAYRSRTGSEDVQILDYGGDIGVMLQHVGVLVGGNAHRYIWPRIVQWVRQHAQLPDSAG